MQAFEEAAQKHQEFEAARTAAITALTKQRDAIDAKIAEVKSWGKQKPEGKKRGRPKLDKQP